MAGAAILRSRVQRLPARVRVVTTYARTSRPFFRMVRVFVGVTVGARAIGCALHVVRCVTIRALGVLPDARCAQDQRVFVARTAGNRAGFFELVGLVATDALRVSLLEDGRGRHQGSLLLVTSGARVARGCRRRVLVLMTGGAHRGDGFASGSVRGFDVTVALGAGAGLRLLIIVRAMTLRARTRAVNFDPRCVAVRFLVTADAVRSRKDMSGSGVFGFRQRERVAARAVRLRTRPKARDGGASGVLQPRLLFVARLAACGSHVAQRVPGQLVTLRALDLLVHHVDVVPTHAPSRLPARRDVDATPMRCPGSAAATWIRARRDARDHDCDREREDGNAPGSSGQRAA
jgi:hypothetical protein